MDKCALFLDYLLDCLFEAEDIKQLALNVFICSLTEVTNPANCTIFLIIARYNQTTSTFHS